MAFNLKGYIFQSMVITNLTFFNKSNIISKKNDRQGWFNQMLSQNVPRLIFTKLTIPSDWDRFIDLPWVKLLNFLINSFLFFFKLSIEFAVKLTKNLPSDVRLDEMSWNDRKLLLASPFSDRKRGRYFTDMGKTSVTDWIFSFNFLDLISKCYRNKKDG
jgi:hypothetical protein